MYETTEHRSDQVDFYVSPDLAAKLRKRRANTINANANAIENIRERVAHLALKPTPEIHNTLFVARVGYILGYDIRFESAPPDQLYVSRERLPLPPEDGGERKGSLERPDRELVELTIGPRYRFAEALALAYMQRGAYPKGPISGLLQNLGANGIEVLGEQDSFAGQIERECQDGELEPPFSVVIPG